MSELELRLQALAVEWPETPELAVAVEQRLAVARPRRPRWTRRRSLAVALAVLAVALGATFAVPGARSALLRFFHLQGVTVELVDELPAVRPAESLDGLGERVSLDAARRAAGFELLRPRVLGEPDAVYFKQVAGMVSFVYGEEPAVRVVFSQVPGRVEPVFLKKIAGGGTRVEQVTVDGEPGLFLSGAPHFFMYVGRDGGSRGEPLYLARDALLWERGPLTLRLEGELTLERALEIARSVR